MAGLILSVQNRLVKQIAALKQKKNREETGRFMVEGVRLLEEALESGWKINTGIFTENVLNSNTRARDIYLRLQADKDCRLVKVSDAVFAKITDTEQPQGLMAIVEKRFFELDNLIEQKQRPLIIVLDNLQDPGNVGTIIRTADAAQWDAVILTKGCADVYAGKTVRATMGSLFHIPVWEGISYRQIAAVLNRWQIPLIATALGATKDYYCIDYTGAAAVVFGNEGNGISEQLLTMVDEKICIPIMGRAESLNVAAAAAVVLYEAVRQRRELTCNS